MQKAKIPALVSYLTTEIVDAPTFELAFDQDLIDELNFVSSAPSPVDNLTKKEEKNQKKEKKEKKEKEGRKRKVGSTLLDRATITPEPKNANQPVEPSPKKGKRKQTVATNYGIDEDETPTKKRKNNKRVALVHQTRTEVLPNKHKRLAWSEEETEALIAGIRKHKDTQVTGGKFYLWRTILDDPEYTDKLRLRTNVMCKDRYRTLRKKDQDLFPTEVTPPTKASRSTKVDNDTETEPDTPPSTMQSTAAAISSFNRNKKRRYPPRT